MVNPTVISTFAGCGGSSLGYHWAGFKELLAIDFDQNSVETFALNFPDVPVWKRDIKTVTADEILNFCNIKPGELDMFDGSPPCQGFSTAGKRKVTDNRNDLFKEFVRLIDGLQPKVFLMENVSGMAKGKMKGKFIEIMTTLKSLNYQVKCKLMNSMYYEVPQSRERLIWIGVRNDLNLQPSFPEPLKKVITVREAFKDVNNKTFTNWNGRKRRGKYLLPELACKIREGRTAQDLLGMGKGIAIKKLKSDKPSPTVEKDNANMLIHYSENRTITIEEMKRIASFPDQFQFIGKNEQNQNRIGNAVMPKFMYHLAKHIKETILDVAYTETRTLSAVPETSTGTNG